MEFKNKLKELRRQKSVSQQELANAIFVSRSAVAKWENGLGMPSSTSYEALLRYFDVTSAELPLDEQEAITVGKNKKIRKMTISIICLSLVVILLLVYGIANAFRETSQTPAFHPEYDVYLSTEEYDFYFNMLNSKEEGFAEDTGVQSFYVMKKTATGMQKMDISAVAKEVYIDGEPRLMGLLYTFAGKNCYYHVYQCMTVYYSSINPGTYPTVFDAIRVGAAEVPVQYSGYFVTDTEVEEFFVGDLRFAVSQLQD